MMKINLSRVSIIQSLRVAAVVEDCALKLDLLEHTLEVQISRQTRPAGEQEIARLSKVQRDCERLSQQMSKLHLELTETNGFTSLLDVVEKKEKQKKDEQKNIELLKELEERKEILREKEAQEQARKENEEYIASSLLEVQSLESKKDLIMELQHLTEQKVTEKVEKILQDKLDLLNKRLNEEIRVHEESEKSLKDQHEELLQQMKRWQELTQQLQQEKKEQYINIWGKKTLNFNRLMEMEGKFREIEQVVIEDKQEQERMRQQQLENKTATKLQAWWRGCMVRRGLGIYKTTAKKKGKKKEGKKKK